MEGLEKVKNLTATAEHNKTMWEQEKGKNYKFDIEMQELKELNYTLTNKLKQFEKTNIDLENQTFKIHKETKHLQTLVAVNRWQNVGNQFLAKYYKKKYVYILCHVFCWFAKF